MYKIITAILILSLTSLLQAQITKKSSSIKKVRTTDRMIIKYKNNKTLNKSNISAVMKGVQKVPTSLLKMKVIRQNSFHANIVNININGKKPTLKDMKKLAKELSAHSDIEYAEPDYIMHTMQVPNDTLYDSEHWHYKNGAGAANLEGAWDITTGDASDVIAVIDTGILYHADLSGKILQGYDFISDVEAANDGDGRDNDARDPGDNDGRDDSSWHGTHVAGTIAAVSNNNEGITGINWNGKILPVRVLGVGGGYTSDITDGMLWAAGLEVSGVPTNENPAKVLNLSLGGSGGCSTTYQNTIDDINEVGAIVVVAAGNKNENASNHSPASCANIITVAATEEGGAKASYSNYGSVVDIAAPGSNIHSTLNTGTDGPQSDSYASYNGTSMATPHVAGIVSLITSASVLPDADYSLVFDILETSAKSFTTGTGNDCTTSICGVGLIDATAALTLASDSNAFIAKYSDSILSAKSTIINNYESDDYIIDSSSSWSIINASLTSNNIGNNESTSYQINMPGVIFYDLSFDWSVSCENDFNDEGNYDGLRFTLEDEIEFKRDGVKNGNSLYTNVLSTNNELNLEWTYYKDPYVSEGTDNGWIDNLVITPYTASSYTFKKDETKKVLIISNNGIMKMNISNVVLNNVNDFSMINNCTQALKTGESCSIIVEYLSEYDTSHSTTLTYNTDAPDNFSKTKVFKVGESLIVPVINYLLN